MEQVAAARPALRSSLAARRRAPTPGVAGSIGGGAWSWVDVLLHDRGTTDETGALERVATSSDGVLAIAIVRMDVARWCWLGVAGVFAVLAWRYRAGRGELD
jgi:hypothetical protein